MSEAMNTNDSHATIRWNLLTSVSALALAATVMSADPACAENADQPQVWIELGGQLDRLDNSRETFAPLFFSQAPPGVLAPLLMAERPSPYGIGEEGKVTFAPEDSHWVFSASIRYGRSSASRKAHYQTAHATNQTFLGQPLVVLGKPQDRFGDGQGKLGESHLVLDFQAGRDVGLGLFGGGGTSIISGGVRFAQFISNVHATLLARPVYQSGPFLTGPNYRLHGANSQNNTAFIQSRRSVNAAGPSISWTASAPIVGHASDSQILIDWGVNAAVLFGRQRAHVHHQTSESNVYISPFGTYPYVVGGYTHRPPSQSRSHSVTIPNVGGFAGISFKYADAKVSIGYRGDFFFNAMDVGIDTRKSSTLGFYGPFASVSVGIGG